MSYSDLRAFLANLGSDLLQVKQAFDPKHEMAALLRAPDTAEAELAVTCLQHARQQLRVR